MVSQMNSHHQKNKLLMVILFCCLLTGPILGQNMESPGELSNPHKFQDNQSMCKVCHSQDMTVAESNCLSCHTELKKRIENQKGFHVNKKDRCERCHKEHQGRETSLINLETKTFNHDETGYNLSGAHQNIQDCKICHKGKGYLGLSSACVSCHKDGHNGKLGNDCSLCHSVTKWDHVDQQIYHSGEFFLSGQHRMAACEDCHVDGVFKGTPTDCQICHWVRRQDDPYKTRLGFECGECHSPSSWVPAQWNHTAQTGFALSGRHAALACDECHQKLNFSNAQGACYSCHTGDYQNADPNHKTAGFPMECDLCHTTSSWTGGYFDHPSFPIQSGAHAGFACSDCHTNPSNFGVFSCTVCHFESLTQSRHSGVPGYSYSDSACYACHPNGAR